MNEVLYIGIRIRTDDKNPTETAAIHVPRAPAEGSAAAEGEDGHEVEDEDVGAAAETSGGASVVEAACIIGTSETATAAAGLSTTAAPVSPSTAICCCCCCATAAASMAAAKAAAVAITLFEVVGSEADEVAVATTPDKVRQSNPYNRGRINTIS